MGIEARFAADDRAESIEPLIDERTCAVFCETIGNPAGNVVDLEAVSAAAHRHGVPLIADNTVPTPLMLKPIEHGADVVVHSLTSLSAATARRWAVPLWMPADSPGRTTRSVSRCSISLNLRSTTSCSPVISPIVLSPCGPQRVPAQYGGHALAIQRLPAPAGLETMAVRLDRHEANARAVAAFLDEDPRVTWVGFAGLPNHPYHQLLQRYLKGRVPSIVTFGVVGGYDASLAFSTR